MHAYALVHPRVHAYVYIHTSEIPVLDSAPVPQRAEKAGSRTTDRKERRNLKTMMSSTMMKAGACSGDTWHIARSQLAVRPVCVCSACERTYVHAYMRMFVYGMHAEVRVDAYEFNARACVCIWMHVHICVHVYYIILCEHVYISIPDTSMHICWYTIMYTPKVHWDLLWSRHIGSRKHKHTANGAHMKRTQHIMHRILDNTEHRT